MNRLLLLSIFIVGCLRLIAQNHYERFESIDIQHYAFEIHLNDTTDRIEGKTTVKTKFLKPAKKITFDLIGTEDQNKGMLVSSVKVNNSNLKFSHKNNQLEIDLLKKAKQGDIHDFVIEYFGIPADGLIISKNKFGERTFFGDNWPDRAKHWLPTIDHPSDKATLEFMVYAPAHYRVISNGYLQIEKELTKNYKFSHWKEEIAIPTKLMVIGVAEFAVGNKKTYKEIPVSSWVFSQNKEQGFKNYKYGSKALIFFSKLVGPYSYEKLAHVQSKTRYGGMENASCIFYHENTATSDRSQERLFSHEVAHQWFGNSVTEQNWHHVWLSEGFATYLTHVYNQHFYGEETFREGLKNDRERIIKYSKRKLAPIIDTTVTDYLHLLNTNSYQKASWFLHMLREDLGDNVFFKGLQKYYADFQNSTALTKDFMNVMETVSGKTLTLFFQQWLWQEGHPVLNYSWDSRGKEQYVTVFQNTSRLFGFPLELEIFYKDGKSEYKKIEITNSKREQQFRIPAEAKIERISVDPKVKLLFEIKGI